jgi:polyisoprenoid-binding protein YceI
MVGTVLCPENTMERTNLRAVVALLCGVGLWSLWQQPEVVAQAPAGRTSIPQRSPPPPGAIDTVASRAYVHVGKTGFGHEHAVAGYLKEGVIHLGAAQNAGTVVFDMRRFAADTTEARRYIGLEGTTSASTQQQVNENMLGQDVLNVTMYPTATFRVQSALPLQGTSAGGHRQYRLSGQFTLHGTTRPLVVDAEAIDTGASVRLRGAFAISQTQFGITPYSKAFGAIGVADKLTIYGEIYVAK